MVNTRMTCPHCNNIADFVLTTMLEYRPLPVVPTGVPLQRQVTVRATQPSQRVDAYGTAACPLCHGPVLIRFEATLQILLGVQAAIANQQQRFDARQIQIKATYPERKTASQNPAYPADVREIFAEAQEDLERKRNPARIVSTCRSVLDVCTTQLNGKGSQLSARIDDLRSKGLLTQPLADWAHAVRIDGNEAIHELKATEEEAQEIVDFIRLFLEVAFVLPARIQERRKAPSSPPAHAR